MKMSALSSQFHLPTKYLATSTSNPSFLIPNTSQQIPTTSQQKHHSYPTILSSLPSEATSVLPPTVAYARKSKSSVIQHEQVSGNSSSSRSRNLIMGVVSVGVVVFLMGMDGQKAMALGPEGPLMEEFWDNVRRYGLYALTVSTGALYATFQPIYELLKNPISAILVLVILAGGIFILSQVVTAMVGVSDFTYDYGY